VDGCGVSQKVCSWSTRFAQELHIPESAPREVRAGKDAPQLARVLVGMTSEEFRRASKGSPMKRAKPRGLERNAAVLLGDVGMSEGVPAPENAFHNREPLAREHAAWAPGRMRSATAGTVHRRCEWRATGAN
jgi:epoxyqueuosine reductase